jgi:hypothetical protein
MKIDRCYYSILCKNEPTLFFKFFAHGPALPAKIFGVCTTHEHIFDSIHDNWCQEITREEAIVYEIMES